MPTADPFREGKLFIFLFAMCAGGAVWAARRYDALLGLALLLFSYKWLQGNLQIYGTFATAGVLGMLLFTSLLAKKEGFLLTTLRVSTWLQMILSLVQYCGVRTFGANDAYFDGLMQGSFGHPIVVGAWFAAVVPLAFKYWTIFEAILLVLFVLLSGTTMAALALLGAFLYYLWRLRGRDAIYLGAICACVCLLGAYFLPQVEFFSASGRMLPWRVAGRLILENPWGYGPGSWFGRYQEWKVPYFRIWDFLHSDVLQLLFEGGFVVFSLTLIALYRILARMELVWGCVLSALFVNSLGAFPFHLPPLAFLACVALACGVKERKLDT